MRIFPYTLFSAVTYIISNTSAYADVKENEDIERIVITGTSKGRVIADTPQSVTQFDSDLIEKFSFSSQADILHFVPGVKVEGGGGEVATNLQVRGLPSAGQFQFTPILIDGIPVFSSFGLNSSAFDVYFRNDLSIERLEFVRGGVSNLFGPGSVAGMINYITKTGTDEHQGAFQIEVAEDNRLRNDFSISGPLDSDRYYAFSGFYRYDEGPIKTGLETEGYQLRGNLQQQFDEGSLTFYAQAIDDKVQFFLPFPLDGASKKRIPGNDGRQVFSVQTDHAAGLSYPTESGTYTSPIADGVTTKGESFSLVYETFFDDLSINIKTKYSDYDHQFNLFLDGDGIINVPETLTQFLANRNLPGLDQAQFSFLGSHELLTTDTLLFANRLLDRDRPADDFTAEFNVSHPFSWFDFDHQVTIGSFFSRAQASDRTRISTYLAEFNNQPRLVDLVLTDVDGSLSGTSGTAVRYSLNGVTDPGVSYGNKEITAKRYALYLADQFENDRWIFDIGVRIEQIEGDIRQETDQLITLTNDPTLMSHLQQQRVGTGQFLIGDVSETDYALSGAALYRLTDHINVYMNASRGFFFPELRGVKFDIDGNTSSYDAEVIDQGELGFKYFDDQLITTMALFFTNLNNRKTVDFINDGQGGVVEIPIEQSTEAWGVEATAQYTLNKSWVIDANFTYQDHEFTEYDADSTVIGKELRRKPNWIVNTGIRYQYHQFDAALFHNYHGSNFANDANTVKLDDFHLFNLDAGYQWPVGENNSLRLSVGVFNLFDEEGVTEGSPRLGNNQTATEFFIGRPILPRRVSAKIKYNF